MAKGLEAALGKYNVTYGYSIKDRTGEEKKKLREFMGMLYAHQGFKHGFSKGTTEAYFELVQSKGLLPFKGELLESWEARIKEYEERNQVRLLPWLCRSRVT